MLGYRRKNYIIIQVATFIVIFVGMAYIFSDKILSLAQKFLIRTKILSAGCEDLKIRKISPVNALEVFCLTASRLA